MAGMGSMFYDDRTASDLAVACGMLVMLAIYQHRCCPPHCTSDIEIFFFRKLHSFYFHNIWVILITILMIFSSSSPEEKCN